MALAVIAVALAAVAAGLAIGGQRDGGDERARAPATATPTDTATPEPADTATPEPTPTPTPTDTPEPAVPAPPGPPDAPDGGGGQTAADLNDAGFERLQAGDAAGAVGVLQDAVAACGDSEELDPCGYALFNLGRALNESGRPAEAIPYLQQRLDGFDFRNDTVRDELDAACDAAGQDCGSSGSG